MDYRRISIQAEADAFFARYGGFHDGIVVSVEYRTDVQMAKRGAEGATELILGILARSLSPAPVVEIAFHGVADWNLRKGQRIELFGVLIDIVPNGIVTFADCHITEWEVMQDRTFVRAAMMEWREAEEK